MNESTLRRMKDLPSAHLLGTGTPMCAGCGGLEALHQIYDVLGNKNLFITVLAYHLVHTIRYRLKQAGIHDSWTTMRTILLPHNRVTVSMQCKNGDTIHVRKSVQPDPEQDKIYSVLGLKKHPGRVVKTTIATK